VPIIIEGLKIYAEDQIYNDGYIEIIGSKISNIGQRVNRNKLKDNTKVISFSNDNFCLPGFIDTHIHGAAGADTMDATKDSMVTISQALPAEGTTSFLATTMTQEKKNIENALRNVGSYIQQPTVTSGAEVLGIHLEGPFISSKKIGAQPPKYILDPDTLLFKRWQKLSHNNIKVVTLAPEKQGGIEFIEYLTKTGVVASAGHSNATCYKLQQAINAGLTQVTHLYNGMSRLHHREPGIVGSALLSDALKAEIIADGVHIHPKIINLSFKLKKDGLIAVTDSLRAKCLSDGEYELGGQKVLVKNGEARLQNGSLAGSTLKMNIALKNIISFTGCTMKEAIKITSANPAKQLGIEKYKGSIKRGKDSDIVILDQNFNVVMTLCKGNITYIDKKQ